MCSSSEPHRSDVTWIKRSAEKCELTTLLTCSSKVAEVADAGFKEGLSLCEVASYGSAVQREKITPVPHLEPGSRWVRHQCLAFLHFVTVVPCDATCIDFRSQRTTRSPSVARALCVMRAPCRHHHHAYTSHNISCLLPAKASLQRKTRRLLLSVRVRFSRQTHSSLFIVVGAKRSQRESNTHTPQLRPPSFLKAVMLEKE